MKNSLPALIAILVAVCALGVTLLRTPETAPFVAAQPSVSSNVDPELGRRVVRIEEEIVRLSEAIESMRLSAPDSREVVASPVKDDGVLDARVVELERQLGELKSARPAATPGSAVSPRAPSVEPQERAKLVEAWTRVAQDAVATEADRLQALRGLRGSRIIDGTDARLNVLPDVIRLAEQSQDARVRADVWRQLHGVSDRTLVAPLLYALQNDSSEDVRAEAAESLDAFLADSVVRSALEFASEHDASAKVRSQARESLDPERR